MSRRWQLHEAKQRFSELIRAVQAEGPQYITRHGEEVAVMLDIVEYRRLRAEETDFKGFLSSAPDLDLLGIDRSPEPARRVDLETE